MSRQAEKTKNASWIIAKKELRLLFKSKRRVFLLSITPMMILLIGLAVVFTANSTGEEPEPTEVWVLNESPSNYTSILLQFYEQINDTQFVDVQGSYDDLKNNPNMNVLVHIPSNFTNEVSNGQPALINIVYNSNSSENQEIAIYLAQFTEIYESQVLVQTPQPDLLIPVLDVYQEETDGISEELASNLFIIPVYIIFLLVIGPLSLVMISVTIEREEKTLESLFLQPVTRSSIIMGKIMYGMGLILTVMALDIIAALIDVILITFFVADDAGSEVLLFLEEGLDLFGPDIVAFFVLVILLISVAVVSLAVLLSLIAKDEREANMISGILPMAIFSIIFLVQAVEITELSTVAQLIFLALPVLGILLAFYLSMIAGSLTLFSMISIAAQFIWIGLIVRFTANLSESESILELNLSRVSEEFLKMLRLRR